MAMRINYHYYSLISNLGKTPSGLLNLDPGVTSSSKFLYSLLFFGIASWSSILLAPLGIKLAASEFIGYIQLANLKDAANIMHLSYQKSIIIATYMLCGFANFASIGIQIGGIGALEPKQRKNLSKFGFKALIGGTIASLLSATIAGMIIG